MKKKTVTYGNGFLLADHTHKSTLPPALSSWSVHLKSVLMFLQSVSGDWHAEKSEYKTFFHCNLIGIFKFYCSTQRNSRNDLDLLEENQGKVH